MSTWWARCPAVQVVDRLCRDYRIESQGHGTCCADDGNRGVLTSVEARTAIALFLRREGKYNEAIQVVRS